MFADLLVIGSLGLIGLPLGYYFLGGLSAGPAARRFLLGWAALWLAGIGLLLTEGSDAWRLLQSAGGTLFSVCLLTAAFALANRTVPGWLWVTGSVCVGLSAATPLLPAPYWAGIATAVIDFPLIAASVVVLWKHTRRPGCGPIERALVFSTATIALLATADSAAQFSAGAQNVLMAAWMTVAMVTAMLQILTLGERQRFRSDRLKQERDVLRDVARCLGGTRAAAHEFVEAFEKTTYGALVKSWGIWSLGPDQGDLDYVAGRLPHERDDPLDAARREALLVALARAARAADGAHLIQAASESDPVARELRRLGFEAGFLVPLRVGSDVIGVMSGALDPEARIDTAGLEFIDDLADQISLVIGATRMRKLQEEVSEHLLSERRFLIGLIETVPVGVLLADENGRVVLMNQLICDQFGLEDPLRWLDKPGEDALLYVADRIVGLGPDGAEGLAKRMAADRNLALDDIAFDLVDGKHMMLSARAVFSVDARRLGRLWVSRDVTQERKLAEQIQQADRMKTVGTLAGGLAHDFNNQLTAILGSAALLEDAIEHDASAQATLADLRDAAEYCASLTQGLLAFARREPALRRNIELEPLVQQMASFVKPSLLPEVELRIDVAADLIVDADELQLQRVVTNLLFNARDAVGSKGVIQLSARRVENSAGERVEIVVTDDGSGIAPEIQHRIFDPFFTTKSNGEGTGLGLAIAHGFAARHGAEMHVESAPGAGTSFRILWPAGSAQNAEPVQQPRAAPPVASGTVLVAEDEPRVRRLVCSALERARIQVIAAGDGEAALAEFEKYQNEIDAALVDLSMPGLNGLEVVRALRERRPDLPAMIMSGHHLRENDGEWPADVPLLQKPFSPSDLVARVAELLAGNAT